MLQFQLQFQNVEAGMQVIILCTTALCPCYGPPPQHAHTQSPPSKFSIKGQNYKCQTVSSCSRFLPLCLSQSLSISFKLQASKLGHKLLYIDRFDHYTSMFSADSGPVWKLIFLSIFVLVSFTNILTFLNLDTLT